MMGMVLDIEQYFEGDLAAFWKAFWKAEGFCLAVLVDACIDTTTDCIAHSFVIGSRESRVEK